MEEAEWGFWVLVEVLFPDLGIFTLWQFIEPTASHITQPQAHCISPTLAFFLGFKNGVLFPISGPLCAPCLGHDPDFDSTGLLTHKVLLSLKKPSLTTQSKGLSPSQPVIASPAASLYGHVTLRNRLTHKLTYLFMVCSFYQKHQHPGSKGPCLSWSLLQSQDQEHCLIECAPKKYLLDEWMAPMSSAMSSAIGFVKTQAWKGKKIGVGENKRRVHSQVEQDTTSGATQRHEAG